MERVVRPGHRQPLREVRNFLLLQHATALGTAVHATPLVRALRDAMPECRIGVVASGMALEIFRGNPAVDALVETPSPLKDLKAAAQSLRAQNPFKGERYASLTTLGNERTMIALHDLWAGPSSRVGFTEVPQLYRETLRFDPARSLIDNNLRIVESFARAVPHYEPEMFPSDADQLWAQQTLRESGVREGQMVAVFVTQTSPTQRKSWRPKRFQAVADFLIAAYGAHIVFVGTASEAAAIETLRAGVSAPESTTSVAGKTSLQQMAALLARCRVGVTLDTGTMHVGRTVQLPMVIIAPAWSPVIEWLPLGNDRYRILKNADMVTCPPDYIIDEVSVDEVKRELASLIDTYPQR